MIDRQGQMEMEGCQSIPEQPVQIVIMLYDGLVTFLMKAMAAIRNGNISEKSLYLTRVLAIVEELYNSLNREAGGEIAEKLGELYSYLMKEVSVINLTSDLERLQKTLDLIVSLREAWKEAGTIVEGAEA
ncbi:MAG: flagellar export chaperone FliS [Nitrospirae bacterium]|nr:MAG: flagellar export chaperone FliS [Nitrospirota bacterium]